MRRFFPKTYADIVQRLRVPSGFLLVAAFVSLSDPGPASLAIGLPMCAAGLALRSWAAGHLRKNQRLTISGPYAWHRNPLYAGTLIAATGCAVGGGGVWLPLVVAAVFVMVYLPVMQLEEERLAELFEEFGAYAERVPQLFPAPPRERSPERFDWAVWRMNREWKGIAAFGLLYAFLIGKHIAGQSL
jgi:protein-S-isoprenylcysteine O-methyltransferase Ste14